MASLELVAVREREGVKELKLALASHSSLEKE